MRGANISYMHTPFANKDFNIILLYSSKFLSLSFTSFAQNTFIWSICDLCNVRRQDLNLKASNYASERCVVFISGGEGAVECRNQPHVDVLRYSQKFIPALKLKYFEYLRKKSEVFQIETSSSGYRSDEEVYLEVGLHFFIFEYVRDAVITLLRHLDEQRLRLE